MVKYDWLLYFKPILYLYDALLLLIHNLLLDAVRLEKNITIFSRYLVV